MKDEKQNKHKEKAMSAKMQKLFRKRWFFPSLYLVVAALILTTVIWLQNSNNVAQPIEETEEFGYDYDEEAVPTASEQETFAEPVLADQIEIKVPFYDDNASAEDQEAALVFYNNKYYQNKGIDYVLKDGETFDVLAAMSGVVTKAEKDPVLGEVVEMEHSDGVTTIYQSLTDLEVKEGDKVEQGDLLGQAGQNTFNKDLGTHAHFEIRKDDIALNPIEHFGQPVSAISLSKQEETAEDQEAEQQSNESSSEDVDQEQEEDISETDSESSENQSNGETKQKDASSALTNA